MSKLVTLRVANLSSLVLYQNRISFAIKLGVLISGNFKIKHLD